MTFRCARLRVIPQHLECGLLIDRVTFHQDALGLFGDGAPAECTFSIVILGEAPQRDVYLIEARWGPRRR
jgi:hypothetical protein